MCAKGAALLLLLCATAALAAAGAAEGYPYLRTAFLHSEGSVSSLFGEG